MDKIKKYLKYVLWLVAFFIFSNFLIYVGLNSSYKDMKRNDNTQEVIIYQAEATKVNGRIRGNIQNSEGKDLNGKYLEIDLYSKRDIFLGRQYIQINELEQGKTQAFEVLFELQDVSSYETKIVDKKEDGGEIKLLPAELTKSQIVLATAITFLIFW